MKRYALVVATVAVLTASACSDSLDLATVGPAARFEGTSIEVPISAEVAGTGVAVVELAPDTGVYIRQEIADGLEVTPGPGVERGSPSYAYRTSGGGTLTITYSRNQVMPETVVVKVNECMNMVDDGVCD